MPFSRTDPRLTEFALATVVLTTSQTTIYTVPAGNRARLETMNIAVGVEGDDDDDESAKVDLWIVPDGETVQTKYRIWWDVRFTGGAAHLEVFPFLLQPGDFIVAKASLSGKIVIRLDGSEIGL